MNIVWFALLSLSLFRFLYFCCIIIVIVEVVAAICISFIAIAAFSATIMLIKNIS